MRFLKIYNINKHYNNNVNQKQGKKLSKLSGKLSAHFHFSMLLYIYSLRIGKGFPSGSVVKNSLINAGATGSIPGSGRFPWRKKWQPTPVFLPGKFHGQRSQVGYSIWGHKELDMT